MGRLSLIVLWVLLASPGLASAQGPVMAGAELQINTYTTGDQSFALPVTPAAFDAQGNFVVVWHSVSQDNPAPFDYGVFGQRYDAAGVAQGGEFPVNSYTTGIQARPAVASDARGNFIVVWEGAGQGDNKGIFAQRYDAAGAPVGGNFVVNTYTTQSQYRPAVSMGPRGNFVVVWVSYYQERGVGSRFGVFGQRFDAAGSPVGSYFQVNTYTTGHQYFPAVAMTRTAGDFVVVWASQPGQDGSGEGIFARRFAATGLPLGPEFPVNVYTTGNQDFPHIASDGSGSFVVVWADAQRDGSGSGIFARRFDENGAPAGADFRVNEMTLGAQVEPDVARDASGSFTVTWTSYSLGGDPDTGVLGQRYEASGAARGANFHINTYTTGGQHPASVASDPVGNLVVAWTSEGADGDGVGIRGQRFGGLLPEAIVVDEGGNGVLETDDGGVAVQPTWRNVNGAQQSFGAAATLSGPSSGGATYQLPDSTAAYGTIDHGTAALCVDCYASVGVLFKASRPVAHWDATLAEAITPDTLGQRKQWLLHVGDSFTDVLRSNGFYRQIETLLHNGVTSGCALSGDRLSYCPTQSTTREQMSKFVLLAKEGGDYAAPPCDPADPRTFADVPAGNGFCPFIEELFRRGIVNGCALGPLRYCPQGTVTREQMAKFVLLTLDPALVPPPCVAGNEVFADVPASSGFCPYIEELFDRGVVNGCALNPLRYCPGGLVTREQMSKFLGLTFEMTLYGP